MPYLFMRRSSCVIPLRLPDDFHEQAAGPDILAKLLINKVAMLADGTNGTGTYTLQFRVLFQQQENLQQCVWLACETPGHHLFQYNHYDSGTVC